MSYIKGVQLVAEGIDENGTVQTTHTVSIMVSEGDRGPVLDVTLEDGQTWMVELEDFEPALLFAKQQYRRTQP